MTDVSIRTLLLEFVDTNGACRIRELHIEILRHKPDTPERTVRARLSEAVSDGLLDRLGNGFYDLYAEDEGMTSVVSYPNRMVLWGSSAYRGNCDGRLIKDLILRYGASKVADPMEGSGTSRDVVTGLNRYKRLGIDYWGGDLRHGFDLTKQELPGRFDFVWIHPPYWNIVQYRSGPGDLSNCESYEQFREMLMVCLQRCYEALEAGGRLAVLIGDVRRAGRYPRNAGRSGDGAVVGYAMRTDRYRFVVWVRHNDHTSIEAIELYDHQNDLQENTNIAKLPANAALVERLMDQWRRGWQGAKPVTAQ